MVEATVNTEEWALRLNKELTEARTRIAALEAQLAEARAAWVPITSDGDRMTCPLPADESIIDVMMPNGDVKRAWFSCNIMDAGDWDILPANENGEPDTDADSLSDAIAWRAISALEATPPAPKVTEGALPQDVIDLVIAAREFWDANDDLSPESRALDSALEGFASRVPYADDPDALTAAQESGE